MIITHSFQVKYIITLKYWLVVLNSINLFFNVLEPSPPVVVTQDIMAQRSRSFAYGTRTDPSASKSVQHARIYAALLSKVAIEFRQRIILTDNVKDDIEYKNTFDGKEAVVCFYFLIITPFVGFLMYFYNKIDVTG
jgi:hypothetical protein